MTIGVSNFATSTLSGGINASVLTITLASGSTFPASGAFVIRIEDELILIDSRSGATLTVNASGRGFEGTTGATHADTTDVYGVLTAYTLEHYIEEQAVDATVGGEGSGTVGTLAIDSTHAGSAHHTRAHDILEEADHADVTNATPSELDLLTFDSGAWTAAPASAHGSHGGGGGSGRANYWAVINRSGSTYFATKFDGTVISSSATFATVFNAANVACSAGGGGQIFLAAGTYVVSSTIPTMSRGVDLVGEGHFGRIADGGAMTDLYGTIISASGSPTSCLDMGTLNYGGMVRDITITGGTATNGIRMQAGDQHIIRCGVRQAVTGMRVVDNATFHTGCRIQDSKIQGSSSGGITVDAGPTDGILLNNHVLQCSAPGTANVTIDAGGWQVASHHFTDGSSGNGSAAIDTSGGPNIWVDNYFDTNSEYGLNISSGNGTQVIGNIFRGHAGGICLRASGTNWKSIMNNRFECNNQSRWAIQYVSANFTSTFPAGNCIGNFAYLFATGSVPYGVVGSSGNLPVLNGFTTPAPTAYGANGHWPQFVCDLNSATA